MRRKNITTISIELKKKEALEAAVINRKQLRESLDSWDDLISYLTYIIENKIDLR